MSVILATVSLVMVLKSPQMEFVLCDESSKYFFSTTAPIPARPDHIHYLVYYSQKFCDIGWIVPILSRNWGTSSLYGKGWKWLCLIQDKCSYQVSEHKVFLIIGKPRQRDPTLHPFISSSQMPLVNPNSRLLWHFTFTQYSFCTVRKGAGLDIETTAVASCPKQLKPWPIWASQVSIQGQGDCRKVCVWSRSPGTALY